MDFLGSRVKLSDIILEEMVAFSNDKETRRAAVRKILKDRGLGQVVQMVDSSKGNGEARKNNYLLEKLVEGDKASIPNTQRGYFIHQPHCSSLSVGSKDSLLNVISDPDSSGSDEILEISSASLISETNSTEKLDEGFTETQAGWKFGIVPKIIVTPPSPVPSKSEEKKLASSSRLEVVNLEKSRRNPMKWEFGVFPKIIMTPPSPPGAKFLKSNPRTEDFPSMVEIERSSINSPLEKSQEWKFGTVPEITVTLPSPPPAALCSNTEEKANPPALVERRISHTESSIPPASPLILQSTSGCSNIISDNLEITQAYNAFMKMISGATPLMKSALMSSKWEVISYLSGISPIQQQFYAGVPEWYTAIQHLLPPAASESEVETSEACESHTTAQQTEQ